MKIIKCKSLVMFLALVTYSVFTLAKVETIIGSVELKNNQNLILQLPITDLPEIIISRPQYIISYNKVRRSPNWVSWQLEANQIGGSGRTNLFETDSELESFLKTSHSDKLSVSSTEYVGSCFDRGHQAPSADRSDSTEDNQATFLMSNMIPQTPFLNRVIWEHLEQHTRQIVQTQNKKAYIIAGPIYDEDLGSIGPKSDIKVPSKNFKIIFFKYTNVFYFKKLYLFKKKSQETF